MSRIDSYESSFDRFGENGTNTNSYVVMKRLRMLVGSLGGVLWGILAGALGGLFPGAPGQAPINSDLRCLRL